MVEPVEPTREGYTFTSWNSVVPDTMPENDVTITATWFEEQIINEDEIIYDVLGLESLVDDNNLESQNIDIYLDVHNKQDNEISEE